MTTATQTQIRRDSATNVNAATPAQGELAYNTTDKELRVGDGSTAGGIRIPNSIMIQGQTYISGTAGGTADALTLTLSPAPAAYAVLQRFVFKAAATNATTSPTLNVNGLGAKTLKKKTSSGKAAVAVGDIQNGCIYTVTYDGTDMQIDAVDLAAAGTGRLIAETVYTMSQRTVTMTIASPCVITASVASLPVNGSPIVFTTTGALPTGITAGTTYYAIDVGADGTTKFRVSTTRGGTAINTSGSQSGTHTARSPDYVKATNNPTTVEIEMVGGGGDGYSVASGGGGGSGAYNKLLIAASSLGSSEAVTPGAAGQPSSFGTSSITQGAFQLLPMNASAGGDGTSSAGGTAANRSQTGDPCYDAGGQPGALNGGGATRFGGAGQGTGAGGIAHATSANRVGYSGKIVIREYS